MTNILLGSKSMDHQLSNALSTMFLRHLVMLLHFETYAIANPQKEGLSGKSGPQLDFLPHIYVLYGGGKAFPKPFQSYSYDICGRLYSSPSCEGYLAESSTSPKDVKFCWVYLEKKRGII